MKVHLALWKQIDGTKITAACGYSHSLGNNMRNKEAFLFHTKTKDACKKCRAIYSRKPW